MTRLMPRSLRARLVLLFGAGMALVLTLSLVLLHEALDRQLDAALAADLAGRHDDLSAAVRAGNVDAVTDDPLAQLYAADGTLLASSPALAGSRLLTVGQARTVRRQTSVAAELPLGQYRTPTALQVLAVRVDDREHDVLAVAARSSVVDNAGGRQVVVLVLAAPILILLLAAAAWLSVHAALHPVDVLTREAAAISSLHAGRRLPPGLGDDEFSRLARTLNSMLDRLQVAVDRERAFVDDASHELRTPLAVLRGELELALGALDDPGELEQSLRAAQRQVERLSRLAEDLLLLARDRAGSLAVNRQPVDLLDVVRADAAALGRTVGLDIEVTGDPAVVDADPGRLRQVLANLAANSAAAGAGRARAEVGRDRGAVTVRWADDGPGFAPELLASAFERFVRGDATRVTADGAGLGLPIVRAIVAAHGGGVEIGNGPPLGGAVVTVRLPTARAAGDGNPTEAAGRRPASG